MWVRSVVSTVALARVRGTQDHVRADALPSVILANASSRLMLKVWTSDIGPSSRQKISGGIVAGRDIPILSGVEFDTAVRNHS